MSWDDYFHNICKAVAANSKCLSCKLGAVLVRDNVIICTGYNGPPRGVPHCKPAHQPCKFCMGVGKVSDTKYTDSKVICPICYGEGAREVCPRRGKNYEADEGLHLCPSIHAERNAIVQAARLGIKIKGSSLYVNYFTPCKDCLVEIINAGIKEVICEGNKYNDKLSGWLIENSSLLIRKYNDANGEE